MKKLKTLLKKAGLVLAITLVASTAAFSETITAVASGDWSSSATWGGSAPSTTITLDQVVIPAGITVNLDNDITLNGALAILEVQGTLTTSTGASITINTGIVSGSGNIEVQSIMMGTGAIMLSTGSITVSSMTNAAVSLQLSADATIQQTLTMAAGGSLVVATGGSLTLQNNATIVIEGGGAISATGSQIGFSGSYNVVYVSGSSTAGVELSGSGLADITIDVGASSSVTLTSNLTVNGTLTHSSGTLAVGNFTLTFSSSGNLAAGGSGTISTGTNGNIVVNANAGLSGALTFSASGNTMNNFSVNVGAGSSVAVSGTLTVNGTLNIASGATLNISAASLTVNGNFSGSGSLSGSANTNLTINASGGISASLNFVSGGQAVNNLTINVGSGNSVELATNLTVTGTLTLSGGSSFDITGVSLTLSGDLSGSGSFTADAFTNITIDASGSISSGISFSGGSGTVGNITIDVGSGGSVSLNSDLTVAGTLTIQSGSMTLNGFALTINGDINMSASAAIDADASSDITIDVNTAPSTAINFSASGNTVGYFSLNISSNGAMTLGTDLTIEGGLTFSGSGSIDIGNNDLTLAAGASISGAGMNAYIITSGSGQVSMQLNADASGSVEFPVGTTISFCPAKIELNSGSASGTVSVSAMADVRADGYAGADLSAWQPVVDATWSINSDISANLDMSLEVFWTAAMEVNGFNNAKAYISHYVDGSWDASASASATTHASGMFSIKRNSITSLSPFAVFDESTSVNVAEREFEKHFTVYPNPAEDYIVISHDGNTGEVINIQIFNATGQLLASEQLTEQQTTLSVEEWLPGSYFIRLYNDEMNVMKKVLKQ